MNDLIWQRVSYCRWVLFRSKKEVGEVTIGQNINRDIVYYTTVTGYKEFATDHEAMREVEINL